MRMKRSTRVLVVWLMCLLFGLFGGSVSVAAKTETLPKGLIVGDDKGIQVGDDGKYFVEHTDIRPGLTFTKEITISNYAKEGAYTLRMDMKKRQTSGDLDLLTAMTLTLRINQTVIYEGDLAGTPSHSKYTLPLALGTYATGETGQLTATFTVSDEYPEDMWKKANTADFYWVFYGTNETEPSQPIKSTPNLPRILGKLPQTGEEWRLVLIGVGIGLLVVSLVLGLSKKRQTKQ